MTASNGTPTSVQKPSSVEVAIASPAHTLGKDLGNAIGKHHGAIAKLWKKWGQDAANHADNSSVSLVKQTDFLNDCLAGIRESLPKEASKNLGRHIAYGMEAYLAARCKVFGSTTAIPYFYQVAGSNNPALFHMEQKPETAKPAKTDAPIEGEKAPSIEDGDKPKTESPEAQKIALLALIKSGLEAGIVTMDDITALVA